jgi:hypothetical protein
VGGAAAVLTLLLAQDGQSPASVDVMQLIDATVNPPDDARMAP